MRRCFGPGEARLNPKHPLRAAARRGSCPPRARSARGIHRRSTSTGYRGRSNAQARLPDPHCPRFFSHSCVQCGAVTAVGLGYRSTAQRAWWDCATKARGGDIASRGTGVGNGAEGSGRRSDSTGQRAERKLLGNNPEAAAGVDQTRKRVCNTRTACPGAPARPC